MRILSGKCRRVRSITISMTDVSKEEELVVTRISELMDGNTQNLREVRLYIHREVLDAPVPMKDLGACQKGN